MSDADLEALEQLASLRDAGNQIEERPEWNSVAARYDEAIGTALANKKIPFTILEIDQLLAAG
jgi:hypothetical protein